MVAGVICGLTDSLSPFVAAEEADITPPDIAMNVLVHELWPVNGKMIFAVSGIAATDNEDPSPTLSVMVDSNEETGQANGRTTAFDWEIVTQDDGSVDVWLRAERNGDGGGRTYTVTATAVDASGNVQTTLGTVTVPHDQGSGSGNGKGG